eukprot:TRINITY_DN2955_c0_g3_i2.p2 TRINITY_DN2955_c0_g3~~TRINITY_DN2955_c0_g3_i2.p2  ORF type:complete len:183 (+),score=68.01 TRINITY_DN2955_c0_g3_i2:296-844(+)
MPDGQLPSIKVRTALLTKLQNFVTEADVQSLKASGLGLVVTFLSKYKHESINNQRQCDKLLGMWKRFLLQMASDYSQTNAQAVNLGMESMEEKKRRHRALAKASKKKLDDQKKSGNVFLPQAVPFDFAKRPEQQLVEGKVVQRNKSQARLKRFAKRASDFRRKTSGAGSAMKMSVEGRGMNV